jgi:DNA-binding NtrC family response regulator
VTRLLIVDDEVKLLKLLTQLFRAEGHAVDTATCAEDAEVLLRQRAFDLLITDVRLPRRSGIDLLREAIQLQPDLQVIVISAYGTVSGAVEAMRLGAFDYVLKPFEMEGLLLIARKALEAGQLRRDNAYLQSQQQCGRPGHRLVMDSPGMRRVEQLVDKVARLDSTVLLLGESGVGKELVAETIHLRSPRGNRPLVRVNCPAIPRDLMESELFGHVRGAFTGANAARQGKLEVADGGTLFLDEVADLPLAQQGKLLRVLENRSYCKVGSSTELEVDIRILAATNRDLRGMASDGEFREDLFYRLNVFPIEVPPLRDRPEDLGGLTRELLLRLSRSLGRAGLALDDATWSILERYRWPGNVRELRNVLERAAVLAEGRTIRVTDLPVEMMSADIDPLTPGDGEVGLSEQVDRFKIGTILAALRACGWKKKRAADRLGLTPRALSHYVQRYDLERYREE